MDKRDHSWQALSEAGQEAYRQGRFAEAEERFLAALRDADSFGAGDPRPGTSAHQLGHLYFSLGKCEQAEAFLRQAHSILEQVHGPEHAEVVEVLTELGALYIGLLRFTEAEPLLRRSVAAAEKALERGQPALAAALNQLGRLRFTTGNYAEAEAVLLRSLALTENNLLPRAQQAFLVGLRQLGWLYLKLAQLPQLEENHSDFSALG